MNRVENFFQLKHQVNVCTSWIFYLFLLASSQYLNKMKEINFYLFAIIQDFYTQDILIKDIFHKSIFCKIK